MLDKEVVKRIKRIVGQFDKTRLHQIDTCHLILKPNTFSNSGMLIDGRILSPISYGDIGVIPLSMTYGLTQDQIHDVLKTSIHKLKEIIQFLQGKQYLLASDVSKEIIDELCLCLNSLKIYSDSTLSDVMKKLSLPNRKLFSQALKVLSKVPGLDAKQKIAKCITPLYAYKGIYGKKHLIENHKELLKEARKSCVPYLTDSSFEQDHFGLKLINDEDLHIPKSEFDVKSKTIQYCPMFFGGLATVKDRTGASYSNQSSEVDPIKKKKLFSKAISTMEYLEKKDDDVLLSAFGKMMSLLNLNNDSIDYDRLIINVHNTDTPFVIPMIIQDKTEEYIQSEYKPLDALDIVNRNMKPSDFSGSLNNKNKPFPFGGDQPLASPRRIKSEVR